MKKNNKSNKLLITLIFTLFLIVVGQLYLMNNIDSYNYSVQNLVSEYNSYNIKNQNLQGEISSNQSILSLKGNSANGKVNYVPSNSYSFNVSSK
jgi:hypothetical protein